MTFREFFFSLPMPDRYTLAEKAGTTKNVLNNIALGRATAIGVADVLVALAPSFGGTLTLDDIPLTERAQQQRTVREAHQPSGRGDGRHPQGRRASPDRLQVERRS